MFRHFAQERLSRGWPTGPPHAAGMLSLLLAAAVFIVDVSTPLGVGISFGYALPVLLALSTRNRRLIIAMILLAGGLTWLAFALASGGVPWVAALNRTVAMTVIAVMAVLSLTRFCSPAALPPSGTALETILEAVPACVWMAHDPDCRLVTGNRACYEFVRIPAGSNLAHHDLPCRLRIDGREVEEPYRAIRAAIAQGKDVRGLEIEFHFDDGTVRCQYGNVVPLLDRDGHPRGAVGAFLDITDLKAAQQLLARKSEELERSNAELEQFAYVASHDLRSPLLSLNGCVQLLAEQYTGRLDPDADELIRFIQQSVAHMADLIRSLLDYARVGSRPLKPAACDMNEVLGSARADLQNVIEATEATIESDRLPVLQADHDQMKQLLQHLLDNALKFRSVETPRVQVRVDTGEREWTFRVVDNGIGIDPQHHARLFQIFQRLHKDESRYPGSGVGLAICKKIVERHAGRMWIEAQPQRGSAVCFTIPRSIRDRLPPS